MTKNIKFYYCQDCGNVIEQVEGSSDIFCHQKKMTLLAPNSVDAAQEKHVPVYNIENGLINIKVGENLHPMEEDHYIMWIALVYDNKIDKVYLNPGMVPEASFAYHEGAIIYAYCNKHGLWQTQVK